MKITITDEVGDGGTVVVEDKHHVAEALRAQNPDAPTEIANAIDEFGEELFRARGIEGVDFDAIGALLGVKFEIED